MVLCEVVSQVTAAEKEQQSLMLVRSKVERIFYELGLDKGVHKEEDLMISKDEFQSIVENKEAAQAIQDLGVDVLQIVDMADSLFAADCDSEENEEKKGSEDKGKELSLKEFMTVVQRMRGTNFATVKDLVNLQRNLTLQITQMKTKLDEFSKANRSSMQLSRSNSRTLTGVSFDGTAAGRRQSWRQEGRSRTGDLSGVLSPRDFSGVLSRDLSGQFSRDLGQHGTCNSELGRDVRRTSLMSVNSQKLGSGQVVQSSHSQVSNASARRSKSMADLSTVFC